MFTLNLAMAILLLVRKKNSMALCFTDKQFYEKNPLLIEFSFCFRQLLVNVVTMRVFAVNVLLGVGGHRVNLSRVPAMKITIEQR